jgi:hypothetical protein
LKESKEWEHLNYMKSNVYPENFLSGIAHDETVDEFIAKANECQDGSIENIIWSDVIKDKDIDFPEIDRWIAAIEGDIRGGLKIIRNDQTLNSWNFF